MHSFQQYVSNQKKSHFIGETFDDKKFIQDQTAVVDLFPYLY